MTTTHGSFTASIPDSPRPSAPVTAEVARRGRAVEFSRLPTDVVAVAKHCVLDWIGVTVAGAEEPVTRMIRGFVLEEGSVPQATLVGTGQRVSASQAALVNGTASHALDFDDVMTTMVGHPTVPVLPAVLAVAQQERLSGRALIAALVAGLETEGCVGRLVMPNHYAAGWHATGTVGTFGAMAGVAHALNLEEEQWRTALGIAGTQAAGLKSMFGTMCKPFHAGKAATNGLLAARLAQRGVTSNQGVLDVLQGFTDTQTTSPNLDYALAKGSDEYDIRDVLFKFHAACYFTHSSIEGITRLRDDAGLDADAVQEVELRVPSQHLRACNIMEPTTALEGKFSLRHTAALALSGRATDDRAFSCEIMGDSALVALRQRVKVTPAPELTNIHASETVLRTRDGRELRVTVDMSVPARGAHELDRQWDRLVEKFVALTTPLLGATRVDHAVQAVAALDHLGSVDDLLALIAGPA